MNADDVWAARVAQLRREAERVAHLLQADGAPSVDPAGQLCRRLEQLEAQLAELAALPAGEPTSWQQLEALEGECQAFFGSYLQRAGGLYLTDGPDGIAASLTPDAAEETGRRLLDAANEARQQLRA